MSPMAVYVITLFFTGIVHIVLELTTKYTESYKKISDKDKLKITCCHIGINIAYVVMFVCLFTIQPNIPAELTMFVIFVCLLAIVQIIVRAITALNKSGSPRMYLTGTYISAVIMAFMFIIFLLTVLSAPSSI